MKFRLNGTLDETVDKISDWTGLTKETIYKMSIYHGIESVKKGFLPKKRSSLPHSSEYTNYIDIPISHKLNKEINDILKGDYYRKNTITKTSLIEQFISIETNRLNAQFINEIDNDDQNNTNDKTTINVRIKVPKIIKDKINNLSDEIGISDTQTYKYLLLTGYFRCIDEAVIDSFVFDADISASIKRLGIKKVDALLLLNDIIHSKSYEKVINECLN